MERVKDTFPIFQLFFQFQRKYTWFSGLNLQVKNWLDNNSSTINSSSICLSGGSWQIIGVNLIIQDSYLEDFKLFFSGRSANRNNQWKYHSNLTFINTFYTYSNYTGSESLFVLRITNAVFVNTTIRNIHNVDLGQFEFLQVTLNSTIHFIKSYILDLLFASLISVSNFSIILFEETVLEHNSGVYTLVNVYNFSSLVIEDSLVRNNFFSFTVFQITKYGHIIVARTKIVKNKIPNSTGHGFFASNNVTIHIFDTIFYENQFQILYGAYNISVNLSNCQFIKNVDTPGLAHIYYYGYIVIENCNFVNNSGNQSISVDVIVHTLLILRDSFFFNNSGITTGPVYVSHSSAQISNVTFGNNHALVKGSCISSNTESRVNVKNSIFYGQNGIVVSAESGSGLSFENCTFVNNSSPADSLIEIHNSTLKLTHCRISNNTMGISGGFVQSKRSSVLVQNCVFMKNRARYGSIFYLAEESRLKMVNSTLQRNTAVIGGCISSANSFINIINTQFHNNKALSSGGAISSSLRASSDISNITLENCSFINHIPDILELEEGILVANNTIFKNNITSSGTMITKRYPGGITLENCVFITNSVTGGALWQFYFNDSILRLSNTTFTTCKSCGPCFSFTELLGAHLTMYTWKSNINIENDRISTTNSTFLDQLKQDRMISTEGAQMRWRELPFASGKLPRC